MMKSRAMAWTGVAMAASMALTGCYVENAYTGDRQVSSTAKGAGIGAAVGAVVGLLTGGDAAAHRKNALILAGVGALAGGAVGNYMDRQQGELRQHVLGAAGLQGRDHVQDAGPARRQRRPDASPKEACER